MLWPLIIRAITGISCWAKLVLPSVIFKRREGLSLTAYDVKCTKFSLDMLP